MSSTYFRNWLAKDDNYQFWFKPVSSEKLDRLLSDKVIQKSIAGSKSNQSVSAIPHPVIKNF